MPIRINLLAEAQALEEIRRRDPAKRALYIAVVLVIAVLVWSGSLQMKLMSDNARLAHLQGSLNERTNEYVKILDSQRKLAEVDAKLTALQSLTTNRFLQATLLNALQRTTVDGIQLVRLRVDQSYAVVPAVPGSSVDGRYIPGKPGSSAEKVVLVLDAKDSSSNPGSETINEFKECLTRQAYFQHEHITTNDIMLKTLGQPMVDTESGKPFVTFTFECRYPERTR